MGLAPFWGHVPGPYIANAGSKIHTAVEERLVSMYGGVAEVPIKKVEELIIFMIILKYMKLNL